MDHGGQGRDRMDTTVMPFVRRRCGSPSASCAAYNLGNFLRPLATPEPIKDWSLTSLKEKLIKIGAKIVSHGRYVTFQMAEVAIPRQMLQEILRLIAELRRSHHRRQHETFDRHAFKSNQEECANAKENGQIRPSNAIPDAWKAGSRPYLDLGFQPVQKTPSNRASSGGIWGIPVGTN